jgi:hypothetical protein
MVDSLRDRDEEVRGLREEVRILREAKDGLGRREREWEERWKLRNQDLEVSDQPTNLWHHQFRVSSSPPRPSTTRSTRRT